MWSKKVCKVKNIEYYFLTVFPVSIVVPKSPNIPCPGCGCCLCAFVWHLPDGVLPLLSRKCVSGLSFVQSDVLAELHMNDWIWLTAFIIWLVTLWLLHLHYVCFRAFFVFLWLFQYSWLWRGPQFIYNLSTWRVVGTFECWVIISSHSETGFLLFLFFKLARNYFTSCCTVSVSLLEFGCLANEYSQL